MKKQPKLLPILLLLFFGFAVAIWTYVQAFQWRRNLRRQGGSIFEELLDIELPMTTGMRITTRLAHRVGDNTIIDDNGVKTDIYLLETKEDVLDIKKSSVVAKILKDF
jgi:FixJ family two-component response regulator